MGWLVIAIQYLEFWRAIRQVSRDHFLKALECLLDIGTGGHIVLYSFNEWGVWDAAFVCGGILAVWDVISMAQLLYRINSYPSLSCSVILC
jgi:hypothetical protein